MRRLPLLAFVLTLFSASAPLRPCAAQIRMPRPKLPSLGGGQSNSGPTRLPTFDDRVLEITDARLTSVLRGLAAEQASVNRLKRLEKRQEDSAAALEVQRRQSRETDAQRQAKADAEAERATDCYHNTPIYKDARGPDREQRMQAALMRTMQAGNPAAMQAFTDSIQRAVMAQDSLLKVAALRCGLDANGDPLPPAADRQVEQVYVRDSLLTIGTRTSGFEQAQYAIMRERILGFLNTSPQDMRSSSFVYSAVEIRVLQAKRDELAHYQELLSEY